MSKIKLYELLKLSISSDSAQINDESYSVIISEGLKDFLDIEVGDSKTSSEIFRVKYLAPSRLVKKILTRCRIGGMSRSDFGIAYRAVKLAKKNKINSNDGQLSSALNFYNDYVKYHFLCKKESKSILDEKWFFDNHENKELSEFDDKGRSWNIYYLHNQQMELSSLYLFILLASQLKWLDHRKPPDDFQPAEIPWGSSPPANWHSIRRRWTHYNRSSEVYYFLDRIDVINSVYILIEKNKEITVQSVYSCFLFEQAFRAKYESKIGKASASQILRRFGKDESCEVAFVNADEQKLKNIFFNEVADDPLLNFENKDIAKFKRNGRGFDKRKSIKKDKLNGKFLKNK